MNAQRLGGGHQTGKAHLSLLREGPSICYALHCENEYPKTKAPQVNYSKKTIPLGGVADRLRVAMELADMKQEALESASGVSQPTIGRYLRGEPTKTKTLTMLAMALDVSPEWLISGVGAPRGSATGGSVLKDSKIEYADDSEIWRRRAKDAELELKEIKDVLRSLIEPKP